MARSASAGNSPLVDRARTDNCSGWNCLGDAAQFGIVLVIVMLVLAIGYVYWRLKIKPNRSNRGDAETAAGGYWEVARRDSNRVSITIYRGPRPSNGPEAGLSDTPSPQVKSERHKSARGKDSDTNKIPGQLEPAGVPDNPDIHLVPPPPPLPPFLWTTPAPSCFPLRPQHSCPDALPPVLPHNPPLSGHTGVDTPGCSWIPNAPLPPQQSCAACSALQHVSAQGQPFQHLGMPGAAAPCPAGAPPPPTTSSVPSRNATGSKPMSSRAAEPRSQWRRWFSLVDRSPVFGHARTLSDDWSPTTSPSRSPSPPAPSISPRRREHGDGNSRRACPRTSLSPERGDNACYRSQGLHENKNMNRPPRGSLSPSDLSYASSYINTSVEAVSDSQQSSGEGPRNYSGAAASDSESGGHRPRRAQGARVWSSDTTPLSDPLCRRAPSRSGPRRRPPSSDIQYPSPERHRPRVLFTLDGSPDDARGSPTSRLLHQSRGTSRGDRGGQRGVHHARRQRKQPAGFTGRVMGALYQMRRILRGAD
ncbi:hypothetical protein VTH06DRAFT_3303 [Thermothelomyces fergusii]